MTKNLVYHDKKKGGEKFNFYVLPEVWSDMGPVLEVPVVPLFLNQSKSSDWSCVHKQRLVSKSQPKSPVAETTSTQVNTVVSKDKILLTSFFYINIYVNLCIIAM